MACAAVSAYTASAYVRTIKLWCRGMACANGLARAPRMRRTARHGAGTRLVNMATTNDNNKAKATVAKATVAPTAAPTMATLAQPPVALPAYPVHGGTVAAVAAVTLAVGQLATVPCHGGTATFAVPVVARYTAGAKAPAWPPLYSSGGGGTAVAPMGGAPGAGAYACPAWCAVQGGGYMGTVHVYHGHAANTAGSAGTGAMVAVAAPRGAVVMPCPDAIANMAKGGAA